MIEVSKELKNKYDTHYSDKTEEWRKIGAIGKCENIINVSKGYKFKNVIEIGAGDGSLLSILSEKNFTTTFTAVEISDSAIEQIKKKNIQGLSQIVQFDGYTLPFKDKEFELGICSHVIEHVEFPRLLLREIKRISKNQIFEVPIDFQFRVDEKFNHFLSYGHINIYTPALFNFLLFTEKFEIIRKKYSLYNIEVLKFMFKTHSFNYYTNILKRLLWKTIPMFMRIKPNTYTVLTK